MNMPMEKIDIGEATLEQLRAFATAYLGLEVKPQTNRDGLRGLIRQAGYEAAFIFTMPEQTQPGAHTRPEGPMNVRPRLRADGKPSIDSATGKPENEVRVIIHVQDKAGGDEPVSLNPNGRTMYVPRGEAHWIPDAHHEVLKNAKELVYEEYTGDGLGGLKTPREVQSYPFSYA